MYYTGNLLCCYPMLVVRNWTLGNSNGTLRPKHRMSTKLWDACLHISSSSPSILFVAWSMSQDGKELTEVGKGNTLLFIYDCARQAEVLPLDSESQNYDLWTQFKTFQINRMGNMFLYLGRGSGYVTSRAAALITLFWRASTNASWSTTAPALKWNLGILMS